MQSTIDLLPVTPSMEQLARIIGSIAAPAFLLGAVASFISVVFSQINRVIDRSHYIYAIKDDDVARSYLKADLPRLRRRTELLHRALRYSILSAILTALIIIVAFISAYYNFAHEYGVALLFVGSLVAFCLSLIDLAREARIALHDNDLRA
jgi:hypothetical protein